MKPIGKLVKEGTWLYPIPPNGELFPGEYKEYERFERKDPQDPPIPHPFG